MAKTITRSDFREAYDKLWDGVLFMKYDLLDRYETGLPNCTIYKRNSWLTLTVDNRVVCSVKRRTSYLGRSWCTGQLFINYLIYIAEN